MIELRKMSLKSSLLKRYNAFTLAEVLITLGIIGVVAAMTIPTLVQNYQKTQYVASLKKAYSTISGAIKQLTTDSGCVGDLRCTDLFASTVTTTTFGDELVKYMSVAKNCRDSASTFSAGGCKDVHNVYWDGSGSTYGNLAYAFITADGMSFEFAPYTDNCSASEYDTTKKVCTIVRIDVNGAKKTNACGRDYFFFTILEDGTIYPYRGVPDAAHSYLCTYQTSNDSCAGRIIADGWVMNY